MVVFAIVFSCIGFAKPVKSTKSGKDKELFSKGHELSYEGQIEHAESLMGKEKEIAPPADDSLDSNTIFLSMIWGAIGTGYFIFGKKQSRFTFLVCGIALCVFPIFVGNFILSLILGLVSCIAPFKIEF